MKMQVLVANLASRADWKTVSFLHFNGINMVYTDSFQNANEYMKMREIASACPTAHGGAETMELPALKTALTRNIGRREICAMIPLWKGRKFSSC